MIEKENIYFNIEGKNKKDLIESVGNKMIEKGLIDKKYIKSMIKRDEKASVAIGNFLAIPHAESDGFKHIKNNGMIMFKLKTPVEWDEQKIYFVIGLALKGDKQIDALQEIAIAFSDADEVEKLYKNSKTPDDVIEFLEENGI